MSRDEFNKLKPPGPTPEEAVLAFLTASPQSAYTAVEIAQTLTPQSSRDDPFALRVTEILLDLVTRKAAVARWRLTDSGPEYFYTVP
jgi:hypothetical protein